MCMSPHLKSSTQALKFFPYNRCDVNACSKCQQHVMRYTEFGGYYVDHRARRLNAELISD